MIYKLDNIKLDIRDNEASLFAIAEKRCGQKPLYFKVLKKSLDARNKSDIKWICTIEFSSDELPKETELERIDTDKKVVIVGSGPAGLFCAVRLIMHGIRPIIIERGKPVDKRTADTESFFNGGELNVNSNVQFGEGGAGTFSDGKLNTQTHDGLNKTVLDLFVRFGAPSEISYLNKPHIGSDNLKTVLNNIRKYICDNGGQFIFDSVFCGIKTKNGSIKSIEYKNTIDGETNEIEADYLVLAIGHSARDTFKLLRDSGFTIEPREFAIGVRIEHLQSSIGLAQYGKAYQLLPSADYKLVSHASERTAFTFCMCPGGFVMPAASEEGGVVTNGMSLYARDGVNANSALLVQVKREDFGSDDPLAGIEFQRKLEQRAFSISNDYKAPTQLVKDFMTDKTSDRFGAVLPTYKRGTVFAPLSECLPPFITSALKAAIPDMAKRLRGFDAGDAVLTAVESRFSSPIRVVRDRAAESVNVKGVFPCGEGCGYSGGITSSAADGLKVADIIFNKTK